MSWEYVLVQVVNGAVIGVIYALIAVGVTLVFSILKIVNFAHGDLYMLGGYSSCWVFRRWRRWRWPWWRCSWARSSSSV
jgi:branched-chain amino acid transport system permease protein